MTEEEKRRDSRESVTLFVEYDGADDLVGDFTENLSSGGTFVATNRDLPIGTRINLVLSFPGLLEPIAIEGTVRWKRELGNPEGDAGAGIEFAPGPARDALAQIIDKVRKEVGAVLETKEFADNLIKTGSGEPYITTLDQFKARIQRDFERYGGIVKAAGIEVR